MIRRRLAIVKAGSFALLALFFSIFLRFLSPRYSFLGRFVSARDMALLISRYEHLPELSSRDRALLVGFVFMIFALALTEIQRYAHGRIRLVVYRQTETRLFEHFITLLRFCYRNEQLVAAFQEVLEYRADCAVLLMDTISNRVIYNSAARFVSDTRTYDLVLHKFSMDYTWHWSDGIYFFDDDLCLMSDRRRARGVCLSGGELRLFIVCRFIRAVEREVISLLFKEFEEYLNRKRNMSTLLLYSHVSQEWAMMARVQRALLPKALPHTKEICVGAFYQPLVNVSGDYYDVISIDEHLFLFVIGDVSGKGLAASLVMGVVLSTIRIVEDKKNLPEILYAVDRAVKRMHLHDKYTTLFLGLIDTAGMNIRYINASMESPLVFTQAGEAHEVYHLHSNCPVIGIVDLPPIQIHERTLCPGDVMVMVSDGVVEVVNAQGVELRDADEYLHILERHVGEHPAQMAQSIAALALNFSADRTTHDDMTIVTVQVKR